MMGEAVEVIVAVELSDIVGEADDVADPLLMADEVDDEQGVVE